MFQWQLYVQADERGGGGGGAGSLGNTQTSC